MTLVTLKESWFTDLDIGFALTYTYFGQSKETAVDKMNYVQSLCEESEYAIPVVFSMDSVIGASWINGATILPDAITLAATADAGLVQELADIQRQEMLALGVRISLSPNADLATDPRWGRNQETYGEDVASRIKAIVGGTTDEKKQRLWDGNADIIYADYSSLIEYTKEGVDAQLAVKIFDTCGKVEGVSSMADAGMTFNGEVFSFNKDFFMFFPKNMDEGILAEINEAMMKVAANPDFQAEMANMKYTAVDPANTDVAVAREYLNSKRTAAEAIVAQCPSLDELT